MDEQDSHNIPALPGSRRPQSKATAWLIVRTCTLESLTALTFGGLAIFSHAIMGMA